MSHDTKTPEDALARILVMFTLHFPDWDGADVNYLWCRRCVDYKIGVCKGRKLRGWKVVNCMLKGAESLIRSSDF